MSTGHAVVGRPIICMCYCSMLDAIIYFKRFSTHTRDRIRRIPATTWQLVAVISAPAYSHTHLSIRYSASDQAAPARLLDWPNTSATPGRSGLRHAQSAAVTRELAALRSSGFSGPASAPAACSWSNPTPTVVQDQRVWPQMTLNASCASAAFKVRDGSWSQWSRQTATAVAYRTSVQAIMQKEWAREGPRDRREPRATNRKRLEPDVVRTSWGPKVLQAAVLPLTLSSCSE